CCPCCSDTQASHDITSELERIGSAIRRRWPIGLLSVLRRPRDGLIPDRREGLATTHSPARQAGPAPGTVKLDRLACVFGTARVEAAGATEQGADRVLVRRQQTEQDTSHQRGRRSSKRTTSSLIMRRVAALTGACKRITISTAGSVARLRRNCSRTMRLTRLRTFARLARRLATTT